MFPAMASPRTRPVAPLALMVLAAADAAKVNPTVPHWGGPVALGTAGTTAGSSSSSSATDTLYPLGVAAV